MPPKTPEDRRREKIQVNTQGMLDNAPTNKTAYLRLPSVIKAFKPQKGKVYKLSFLPWRAGKFNRSGKAKTWVANRFFSCHPMIGPMEESHLCPAANFGKPCPVCEQFQRLRAQRAEWDQIKDLKPRDRELFLVHDEEDNNPRSVMLWDESVHLFGNAFRLKINRRSQYLNYASPYEDGMIVEVCAAEKKMGQGSCVDCTQGIEIEARGKELDGKLLDLLETLCPDDWLVETPYDRLKKLVSVGSPAGEQEQEETTAQDEEEEVEEQEDEDEDEEVEEEVEEEEETPPPPPKKGKKDKAPPPPPEPEEEEEDDEDEEEEDEEAEEEEYEEVEEEEETPPPPPKKKRK